MERPVSDAKFKLLSLFVLVFPLLLLILASVFWLAFDAGAAWGGNIPAPF